MMEHLAQIILLLAVAVAVVVVFQRLHVPTSLGYLLVGVILGPHTIGPKVQMEGFETLSEFGVVFLLFTIGLSYSLPQIHALRHQVLGLGTAQVVLSTVIVGLLLWLIGLSLTEAFVFGAIFAQSSSTIIASILGEQGELNSPHGRLGLAISVFQDVTAVPFLVVIPVLGLAVGADVLATSLGWAMAKAVLAFALVFFAGKWLLRPLFHFVAKKRSPEVFTLAVLLVALLAAWSTNQLGLSLAFGAFLAGMMLGETEFRHQVESSIRPFRDVLLGMFFIGIGMLFDPASIPGIWHWSILGALTILLSKILIVAALVRKSGLDVVTSWSTGLIVSVGGEFGLALLAIALSTSVIDQQLGQIALTSVLLSMVGGALLIRFNLAIANRLAGTMSHDKTRDSLDMLANTSGSMVLIGGYGRMGHTIAVLLETSGVQYLSLDTDPKRVAQGRADGHSVMYGDIADPDLLAAVEVERYALVVITVDHSSTALRAVEFLRQHCPQVPIIARARDLESSAALLEAGATHAYPEAIEASLRLGATALQMLQVPVDDVENLLQGVRDWDYQPVLEDDPESRTAE